MLYPTPSAWATGVTEFHGIWQIALPICRGKMVTMFIKHVNARSGVLCALEPVGSSTSRWHTHAMVSTRYVTSWWPVKLVHSTRGSTLFCLLIPCTSEAPTEPRQHLKRGDADRRLAHNSWSRLSLLLCLPAAFSCRVLLLRAALWLLYICRYVPSLGSLF